MQTEKDSFEIGNRNQFRDRTDDRHSHEQVPEAELDRSDGASVKVQRMRQRIGLHPTAPIDRQHDLAPHQNLLWSRIRLVLREPLAEFFGTFILVAFGNGSVAQVLLSTGLNAAPGGNGFGSYQSISWG